MSQSCKIHVITRYQFNDANYKKTLDGLVGIYVFTYRLKGKTLPVIKVGQTTNLRRRLSEHRHKEWDEVHFIELGVDTGSIILNNVERLTFDVLYRTDKFIAEDSASPRVSQGIPQSIANQIHTIYQDIILYFREMVYEIEDYAQTLYQAWETKVVDTETYIYQDDYYHKGLVDKGLAKIYEVKTGTLFMDKDGNTYQYIGRDDPTMVIGKKYLMGLSKDQLIKTSVLT